MALPRRIAGWLLLAAGLIPSAASAQFVPPYPPGEPVQGCVINYQPSTASYVCQDQGQAYAQLTARIAELNAHGQAICATRHGAGFNVAGTARWSWRINGTTSYTIQQQCTRISDGTVFSWGNTGQMDPDSASWSNTCASRPIQPSSFSALGGPSRICGSGCVYELTICIGGPCQGGGNYEWFPTGNVCTTEPGPKPDRDGDGEPDETDEKPDDPTCKVNCGPQEPDPDEPDPEDPNEPGNGGADMSGVEQRLDAIKESIDQIPPRLDAINSSIAAAATQAAADAQATIAAINGSGSGAGDGNGTEAIVDAIGDAARCVGRGPGDGIVDECDNMSQPVPEGTVVTGGESCSAPPTCTGQDGVACSTVIQLWRTRCETVRIGEDLATWDGPTDDGETPEIWGELEGLDIDGLDSSGFGWARSCPQLPSVGFMGHTISADPEGDACSFLQLLSNLILLAGFVHAGYIVASKGRG
jgi:hypothetical protein